MPVDVTAGLLERAVAATQSGIAIADALTPGFPLTYVNEAFSRLTGYSAEQCLGRNCRFLQGPDTDPAAVAKLAAALRDGQEAHVVLLNNRRDGTPFFNELRISPVRDDDGRMVQVVGVQNDVSALVHTQRALELERDRALTESGAMREALTPRTIARRPGLALASVFVAAADGVAGDFHLVMAGPGTSSILVVGDAMGHGLRAARLATFVRTTLATFARFTDDPHRLLELTNSSLVERTGTSTDYVTAVCASYDPESRTLRWASAGHPVPLWLDTAVPIGGGEQIGKALGVAADLGGSSSQVQMLVGDGILLRTDGLSEAYSARGHARLGEPAVQELITDVRGQSCPATADALRAAVLAHSGRDLADDLCLLVMRATE